MKFENNGIAISATWAWHEAFSSGIHSVDFREVLNTLGVQFTARGADNKIMDHVGKGMIQQAISILRINNPVAWAWGMHAFAPEGTENANTLRNTLFKYALQSITTEKFNAFMSVQAGSLAFVAMQDARTEANSGARYRRKAIDMANAIKVDEVTYKNTWQKRFFIMKDALKDLSGQALPPVANVIWVLVKKVEESGIAINDLSELLQVSRR